MNVEEDEGIVPRVHAWGQEEDSKRRAYLVTDYIERGGSGSTAVQRTLGTKLAQMHKAGVDTLQRDQEVKGKGHGFPVPTHCGATEMDNTWEEDWPTFFAERRIGDIVKRIGDSGLTELEQQLREHVYPLLLEPLKDVKPTILHGDLWGGNYIVDERGQPFVFDPSAYYGHNEADLGMTTCFGGYSSAFYEAYHKIIPKVEPYYEQRIQLYALFHWLNHELMFGAYRSTAVKSAEGLIAWAKKEAATKSRKAEL
ncbi:Ketosamine-3-kinase [Jaminaea rosea]|uniref:protein-ribulosamine 3-kinase n=1 Tax=Jaminaea rosea TaxID=1569628 RepID=A0A316UTL9_9BASI|nr:Ketosamine-3-kinase [Jaminaea rosea]PWN28602.1 Ketosamine-3-kinase [Jaminaea rosea]